MTLICEPDPGRASTLIAALDHPAHVVPDLYETTIALAADDGESVLVIGVDVELDGALSLAVQLRAERPGLGVILLRDDLDVGMLTRAMRAGVREVLPGQAHDELAKAVARSRQLSAQTFAAAAPVAAVSRSGARVITVFSAKGGTGKTTLACNLAVVLNAAGARVCLVDLDLAFGDVAISLQLEPRRTIVDAVADGEAVDPARVGSVLTPYRPGLDCILAPVQPGDADKVPAAAVGQVLEALGAQYDFVVIDTPSQLSEHVLAALDASHHHVLVTTPEVPALKNLRLTLDMLDLLSYNPDSRAVVLNRSDAKVGLSAADVERVVRNPISGYVPSSRDVPAAINRGVPLAADQPNHPVSAAIRKFAEQHITGSPVLETTSRRPGLKLWRRSA
jgi:Flp pilus assembly CpaE family ATPase